MLEVGSGFPSPLLTELAVFCNKLHLILTKKGSACLKVLATLTENGF